MTSISLIGGHVLTPDGALEPADLHIADGRIVDAAPARPTLTLPCDGLTVLPGIVDVHGDAFEREIAPRPGVKIDLTIALPAVDRLLLAHGITTAFHGLTLTWEPGERSLDAARRFMDALPTLRGYLRADHRVQLRWETFAHDAIDDVARWLRDGAQPTPALAFNDHTTGTLHKIRKGNHKKLDQWAQRAGLTRAAYAELVGSMEVLSDAVPARIEEVAALGRAAGAVMLSHDEMRVDERAANRARGVGVCEFPMAEAVARDAVVHGEATVLGGPNVVRGGSHTGALGAQDAIAKGLCTVLASDYYYPSLLHAAERLVDDGTLALPDAWALISTNAAAAMGLDDRGTLAPGQRADVVVIDTRGRWRPQHTIAHGKLY
ncbi:MAG: alpha-D-ribose 1-methylphosphonate 5-triphosphate diphosphatase [Pseudomonadota bacterium]